MCWFLGVGGFAVKENEIADFVLFVCPDTKNKRVEAKIEILWEDNIWEDIEGESRIN